MCYEYAKYKKTAQKTRSTKQTIILRCWRSFCHLFMIILILLVLNKAQNLLNLQQVRSSFCLACVMEEGLIGITDLTTPSITLIAKCGLIDGVNILPKIGNDDAYQKSRKMIYTPYSTSPHIHIPTVCNNWYRPKTVYIFKNWCYFPRLVFFSRMRLLRFFSDIRINMQETVDLNFTSTFFSSSNFCSDTFELIFVL